MDHLLFDGCCAQRGRWRAGLLAGEALEHIVGQALRLETDADHAGAHQLDGLGVGRVQKEHGGGVTGAKALLPHLAQQVAHVHRHFAEVDVDWAGAQALVAHRAVVGHIFKLFPMLHADAASRLFLVQKRLHQQRGGEDFVAR